MTLNIGIHRDVPFDEYLAIEALSNSAMNALDISPRHFRYAEPIEPTRGLRIGSLGHTGFIEPLEIGRRFAVMPDYNLDAENVTSTGAKSQSWSTGYAKAKAKKWTEANQDKQIVSRDEYDAMVAIVESLSGDADAQRLFGADGPTELSMVWQDEETGVLCKGRIDKLIDSVRYGIRAATIIDLKTTGDISRFPSSIAKWKYHRQMSHYRAGYQALTGVRPTCWLVVVESSSPYCVQAAPMSEESLEIGDAIRRRLIRRVAECIRNDDWPGPPSPAQWTVPDWTAEELRIQETETEVIVV